MNRVDLAMKIWEHITIECELEAFLARTGCARRAAFVGLQSHFMVSIDNRIKTGCS